MAEGRGIFAPIPRRVARATAIWCGVFAVGSVYLLGTTGLTHRFRLGWLSHTRVEGFRQAEARPWKLAGSARIIKLSGADYLTSFAMSPDDKYLVVGMASPGRVVVFAVPSGRKVKSIGMPWVGSVDFSGSGDRFAAVGGKRGGVLLLLTGQVRDGRVQRLRATTVKQKVPYGCPACFYDRGLGVAVAGASHIYFMRLSGGGNTRLRVRNFQNFGLGGRDKSGVLALVGTVPAVVAFSPRGPSRLWKKRLPRGSVATAVSASQNGHHIWVVGVRHRLGNESWALNPVGSALAAGGQGRVWSLGATGGAARFVRRSSDQFTGVAFDPRGEWVALGLLWDGKIGGSSVVLASPRGGKRRRVLALGSSAVLCGPVRFSMDGRYVLALCNLGQFGHGDTTILIWRVRR